MNCTCWNRGEHTHIPSQLNLATLVTLRDMQLIPLITKESEREKLVPMACGLLTTSAVSRPPRQARVAGARRRSGVAARLAFDTGVLELEVRRL